MERFGIRKLARTALGLCVLLTAGIWFGAAGAAEGDESNNRSPQRLVIGLDLSRSNPLVDSKSYAAAMGDFVADYVKDLPLASQINLRTFGAYNASSNNLRIDRSISSMRDEKPAAVAELVRQIIANVPKLVHEGTLESQSSTNILAFLENMSDIVDCRRMDTTIVLVSDGVEDSEYARLSQSDEHLPRPSYELFRGCSELEILGLGQGQRSPAATERLKREWEAWAKAAGFHSFVGLNSW